MNVKNVFFCIKPLHKTLINIRIQQLKQTFCYCSALINQLQRLEHTLSHTVILETSAAIYLLIN